MHAASVARDVTGVRGRPEWKLIAAFFAADPLLAAIWFACLFARALAPTLFAIAAGRLVGAAGDPAAIGGPVAMVAAVFVLLQVLPPIQQTVGMNLGSRTAAWLHGQLTQACVQPPGIGHLEDPTLATDLTMARDFDRGISGPPLSIAMSFIAGGIGELLAGIALACVLIGYAWWAPLLLGGAWASTHWFLRESGVWRGRNTAPVRDAQRRADYAYRLAVDPPAAKEVRLFGLAGWVVERFRESRVRLFELRYEATRLRERPLLGSVLLVLAANIIVVWAIGQSAAAGRITLAELVRYVSAAAGTFMIAFGGLSWALDGAAAPAAAVARLRPTMAQRGDLPIGTRAPTGMPAREIRFRDVTFAYPSAAAATAAAGAARAGRSANAGGTPALAATPATAPAGAPATAGAPGASSAPAGERAAAPVLDHFDLTIPAGTSLALVGVNGAGKTTIAKLLCRLYDPQQGAIEIDGVDLRELDVDQWRSRLTAVFQDFIRFEWPLRRNVAPAGADDGLVREALALAGASDLAALDTILGRGYAGGTDLSGGQWQRVAIARALCAVSLGAGVVLLDEPTAQLDVRGEAEIFDRVLAATRHATTILISHRFSTVRHADRIAVIEHGRIVELGSHAELMAIDGRYRAMFDLQALPFSTPEPGAANVVA